MHDIDRVQLDFDSHETFDDETERRGPYGFQREATVFDETEEMELAAELLGVSEEAELDEFLGGLIDKAGKAIGKAVKSPVGRKLGGFLKGAASKVLPAAAGVVGTAFGGPAGGMLAAKAASAAGDVFGLELEGMSPEDQHFETARRFVRFAGEAARQASRVAQAPDPKEAARTAVVQAARKLAPGLLKPVAKALQSEVDDGDARGNAAAQSGRWVRQGQKIVLIGA